MTTALLEVRDASKQFGGITAVDGVSLSVGRDERVALVGPNGAGKTTLFNLIAGSQRATSGTVRFDGHDVTAAPAHQRARLGIARSFQNLGVVPDETVLTNVLAKLHVAARYRSPDLVVQPWRVWRRERELLDEAMRWIVEVGLESYAHRPVRDLSFGLARRAELAGVLALRPKLLLLDEPTAGLTVDAAHDLFRLLAEVQAAHGLSVLLIGHDLGFVLGYANRAIAMSQGRTIAEGSPDAVRSDATVTEAYLGGNAIATNGWRAPSVRPQDRPEAPSDIGRGLVVTGLHAGYRLAPVLQGVDLHVAPGEFVAVVGANGTGKSTLFKAIYGQLSVARGSVLWDGRRIEMRPPWARAALGITHVPQGRHLFADMTVSDNLELGAMPLANDVERTAAQRRTALTLFPRLEERLAQPAGSLSGGEQQMLAIARGLMAAPKLLLLDEASLGLSPKMAAEVAEALHGIKALGISILAIEHRPWLLERDADRVCLLDRGRVAWSGDLDTAMRRGVLRDVHLGTDARLPRRRRTPLRAARTT